MINDYTGESLVLLTKRKRSIIVIEIVFIFLHAEFGENHKNFVICYLS